MAITGLRTWTAAETITAAKLNADNSAIEDKFNGAITNADVASSAAIANSKLANQHYEVVFNLNCSSERWQGAGNDEILAIAAVPGDSADGTYTGLDYGWACTDCGAQTGKFRVEYGYFDAATAVWTVVSTLVSDTTLTAINGNDTAGVGGAAFTTAITLASAASAPRFIALVMDTDDATALSTGAMCVTLKFKRTNGLRS